VRGKVGDILENGSCTSTAVEHLPSACDLLQDKGMIGGRQGMRKSKLRYRAFLQRSMHASNFHPRQLHRQLG